MARKQRSQRICVPLGRERTPDDEALSYAAVDLLREWGHDTRVVADGDDSLLKADTLLLIGDCLLYPHSTNLLRAAGSDAPQTVLWQLDPLPPVFISEKAMEAGLKAARLERRIRLPKGRIGIQIRKLLGPRFPFRLKSVVLRHKVKRVRSETSAEEPTPSSATNNSGAVQTNFNHSSGQFYSEISRFSRLAWIEQANAHGWLRRIAVSTPERLGVLNRRGVKAGFVPVGYYPQMGEDRGNERDIDVLFFGSVTPRRAGVLEMIRIGVRERGVELVIPQTPCFGEMRTALLNRTKVTIHINREEMWEPARTRLLLGMACGALVVSEEGPDLSPLVPGKHLVTCPADMMVDTISHYLSHEGDRDSLTRAAGNFIRRDLRLEQSLKSVMQLS